MAWQHISPNIIAIGFMKCCMSNAVGENDSEENGDVRSEC